MPTPTKNPSTPLTFGFMCAEDLPPLEMLAAAYAGGFDAIGLRLTARYITDPDMGLVGNRQAIAAIKRRARELGVRISNISSFYMRGDVTLDHLRPVIEATAELGAKLIVANRHDPDEGSYLGNLAAYCEAAAPYGIRLMFECMPYSEVKSVDQAARIIAAAAQPNLGFLPDPLHLRRAGCEPAEIAKIDPSRIYLAQICDAPLARPADIVTEARTDRLLPGEGELPLDDFLASLPPGTEIECETPCRRIAQLPPAERSKVMHDVTARFIESSAARRTAAATA